MQLEIVAWSFVSCDCSQLQHPTFSTAFCLLGRSDSNFLLCYIAAAAAAAGGSYYAAQTQYFPFVQPAAFLFLVPQQVPPQAASGSKCTPKRERKLVVTTKSLYLTNPKSSGWKNKKTAWWLESLRMWPLQCWSRVVETWVAFTSMSWQIRIRDPNQGGRDITEEIMSGVWSTTAKDAPKVWKFFLQTQPCAAAGVALNRNNLGRVK